MLFKTLKEFLYEYEMPLAQAFHEIDRRGVLVDETKLSSFIVFLDNQLGEAVTRVEAKAGKKVIARQEKKGKPDPKVLNLSSPTQLGSFLKGIGLKLKTNRETGRESTDEESLNEAFAATGNPVLKDILSVRELNKIKGTYAETALVDGILYSSYNVAGTVTGRRSSSETPFKHSNGKKIGTNVQNLPKHSDLGLRFRECVVARPGRIFISCDQVQAEDWIVQGIIVDQGGSGRGLEELQRRVDRHRRLATQIFQKTWEECNKDSLYRYLGKKTRHARNYDMEAFMMATVLVKEGFSADSFYANNPHKKLSLRDYCQTILNEFDRYEPDVKGVFQEYVKKTLLATRTLTTPIGRSRYFFGFRPGADNKKLIKEGYSYIPQSTVADNTGLAILYSEYLHSWVVMDGHDSVTMEVPANRRDVLTAIDILKYGFNRVIEFPNGTKLKIPIEYELGYNLRDLKKWETEDAQATEKLDTLLHGLHITDLRGPAGLPSVERHNSSLINTT
jgi:DNA polymerase family A